MMSISCPPARGVHPMHPLPFSGDGLHGSGRIVVVSIIQGPQHVLGHEPRFTVHIHDAHGAELGILENLHVVHRRSSFGAQLIRTYSMCYRTFTFAVASRAGASLMSKPSRFTLVASSL